MSDSRKSLSGIYWQLQICRWWTNAPLERGSCKRQRAEYPVKMVFISFACFVGMSLFLSLFTPLFSPNSVVAFLLSKSFQSCLFLSLFLCVYSINRNSLVVWHWHWINTIVPLCVKELLLEQNNVLCHNLMLYTTNKKKSTSPLKPTVWMNSLPSRLSDMLLHAHAEHVYCIKYFLILLMVPCVSSILILARLS